MIIIDSKKEYFISLLAFDIRHFFFFKLLEKRKLLSGNIYGK